MDDKIKDVVAQYHLDVYSSHRGRGAFICETDQGLKIVKEYNLSPNRLSFESMVKYIIKDRGYMNIDQFLVNKNGEIITKNKMDRSYVIKDWYEGHECDTKNPGDVVITAKNLAILHKTMKNIYLEGQNLKNYYSEKTDITFYKHNRELKAIKNYMKNKHQKNNFEMQYLNNYDYFYQQGDKALKMLNKSSYAELYEEAVSCKTMCHGDYNQHNVIIKDDRVATTNFDKLNLNVQINDLYLFIRKVMEKNHWDVAIGKAIIEQYNEVKELTKAEMEYLYILLLYPEKFWKISNHYYNTRKSWTSGRNIEKISAVIEYKEARENFLAEIHRSL